MKTAQEIRAGNVVMIGTEPMVVQKAEFNKSGRNSAVVKKMCIRDRPQSVSSTARGVAMCSITPVLVMKSYCLVSHSGSSA